MKNKEKKKLYRILNTLTVLVTLVADRTMNEYECGLWKEIQEELEEWETLPDKKEEKEKQEYESNVVKLKKNHVYIVDEIAFTVLKNGQVTQAGNCPTVRIPSEIIETSIRLRKNDSVDRKKYRKVL